MSIFKNFINLLGDAEAAVDPLYEAITAIGPYAISIVLVLGLFYAIILGVKISKAPSNDEVQAAKKQLINAIIGVVAVVILLSILYAIRGPLIDWANS
ncbi:MAG: hypothetical protein IJW24_03145 [Clostridia bacterium]|nr:hypothetical protein [Clostridia bacterium]